MDFNALAAVEAPRDGGVSPTPMVRDKAIREAAWSYGARGGLAHRTWEITNYLNAQGRTLDQVFDFRRLLIALPNGLLLQPPVYIEGKDAFELSDDGQQAAVTDTAIFKIEDERVVPTAKLWGNYLLRPFSLKITPPPSEVFPTNSDEEKLWKQWLAEGWAAGIQQADETFQADLDRMVRDFVGMVRFRYLYAEGMATLPYAAEENKGVTGGGRELRIGNRSARITGQSVLLPKSEKWQPADH